MFSNNKQHQNWLASFIHPNLLSRVQDLKCELLEVNVGLFHCNTVWICRYMPVYLSNYIFSAMRTSDLVKCWKIFLHHKFYMKEVKIKFRNTFTKRFKYCDTNNVNLQSVFLWLCVAVCSVSQQ
jgi:hypothetical protein